ncbi:UDP-N-acetylmuramoyl-L-alanine--D-glutamate ligase [Patescibacteria group bacterium]
MSKYFYSKPKDFTGKRVTVMGLGLSGGGVGVARFLAENGAKVLVTDLRDEKTLKESLAELSDLPIEYRLGEHKEEDFTKTDLVVKNPAVPWSSKYIVAAKKAKVPVDMEIGIFLELNEAPILGVTGTKGKTTTATLLAEIMKAQFPKAKLAGNVRVSPLTYLDQLDIDTPVVLELSSFQLEIFEEHKMSPQIAIITNIFEDHLDRYDSLEAYVRAKENIFRFQKEGDYLILDKDNAWTKKFKQTVKAEKIPTKIIYTSSTRPSYSTDQVGMQGVHNLANIDLAVLAAKTYGIKDDLIAKVVKDFKGVENRLEFVRKAMGVKFYNDTTSTIPEATIAAIKSFEEPVILIAGGSEKNVTYEELAKEIVEGVKHLILFNDSASPRIEKAVLNLKIDFPISYADTMPRAVELAQKNMAKGDVVVMSPAAASFGLFKNEFDRGDQYIKAVKKIK